MKIKPSKNSFLNNDVPSPSLSSNTIVEARPTLRLNIKQEERTASLSSKLESEAHKHKKAIATGQKQQSKNLQTSTKKDQGKEKGTFKKMEVNQIAKRKSDDYFAILKSFQEKFPLAFTTPPKLLAIDIHKDLLEQSGLTKNKLKVFMFKYCNSKKYKESLKEGAERVNLRGEVTGKYEVLL